MPAGEILYCEMCGARIVGRPYRAIVDGVEMILCERCYLKLTRSGRAQPVRPRPTVTAPRRTTTPVLPRKPSMPAVRRRRRGTIEMYDIVEDYGERIRRAREARGWSLRVLAQKLRISETMLRRIEQEKMKPSIDLARRIERVLKIELLIPTEIDEEFESPPPGALTLGDVVVIRRDED